MKESATEVTIVIVTHNMQQAARVSDPCAFFPAAHGTPGVTHPEVERTHDCVNGRLG